MRLTVKEFKQMVIRSFAHGQINEKRGDDPGEFYETIEFRTESKDPLLAFMDRWGRSLPSAPDSLNPRDVRLWLDEHNVRSVIVKKKTMTPQNFIKFLRFVGQPESAPPSEPFGHPNVIRGLPIGGSKT